MRWVLEATLLTPLIIPPLNYGWIYRLLLGPLENHNQYEVVISRESQVVQQSLSTHIYINICSSGSSSRMALVSSSITIPTEVTDSEWTLSNKMTPISLHPPGIQCSSPVTPVEPKQMVLKPHSLPNRDYEAVLQRFDCIALEWWRK